MKFQRGATLIVVLIVLLLITIIGVYAVRQSLTGLNIATSNQAQQALFQSSDVPLYQFSNGNIAGTVASSKSLLGYAKQNSGSEVVFCFRSGQQAGTALPTVPTPNNTSLIVGGVAQTTNGFCDANSLSSRSQLTQVTIVARPTANASQPFSTYIKGTDTASIGDGQSALEAVQFRVYVTSVLPALSTASVANINACLRLPSSSGLTTQASCLNSLSVPFNTQVEDFQQTYCVNGVGC
ncbi:pilus assembly protein PilX [Acinetobacter nectaris]|uniref:pilus assembly protein PilX n=1 Tax=Acinetobacter nectaris TaxID=1219382 RepID=UPI001F4334B6|nr:pilus assembly protein PilX [Acinetobacter nectaris]MCF9034245.1 pilus assembly protein PilX [Acinetobacter nectaris]